MYTVHSHINTLRINMGSFMIINVKWIFAVTFLSQGISFNTAVVVYENSNVTIPCPLTGDIQHPTWTGPAGLANPLTQGQTINEPGFQWVNNTDLKLFGAKVKHDGIYTCTDAANNTAIVKVDVEYFSAWAEFTPASPSNTRTVMSCYSHSNPETKIIPHVVINIRVNDMSQNGSVITHHPCEPDPSNENKTKCSVTAVLHVSKEDNGVEMSCAFDYKNRTALILYPKVVFKFPPTIVNITGNRNITDPAHRKLKLTCSTDSSNPVSSIVWRKGTKGVASENNVIDGGYGTMIKDAEYNGKNVTENIDIEVDKSMSNEKVFCCAVHMGDAICDSITLDYLAASAGSVVGKWMMALVLTFMALIAV